MTKKIFSKHLFEYKGLPVAYQKGGEGRPLLILHGWGSKGEWMMSPAQSLISIRTCYVIDFPGFGDSPEPKDAWSVGDYAEMIRAFIDHLYLPECDFLVHSFGGRVMLKLLAEQPSFSSKIGKVLITGGAGLKPKRSFSFYKKKIIVTLAKAPFALLRGSLKQKGLQWLRNTKWWKGMGSSDYQKLTGVMRQVFVKTVNEHLDHLLPVIQHEVLLVWGENDTATPMDQAKRMEKGIARATLIPISDAGHYAFIDAPAIFNAIAKAYFEAE